MREDDDDFEEDDFDGDGFNGGDDDDWDEEPDLLRFPVERKSVGRNDQCPCGSGKKYKKCCLNEETGR